MATSFNNSATLSYNGTVTTSNTVTGEIVEVLSMTKSSVTAVYSQGDTVTYVVSLINSGSTAYTGLMINDDLGVYVYNTQTLVPLTYVDDSVTYYVNGVLQTAPTVTSGPPLHITGLSVPAGGNAMIVYQAVANQYAPLSTGSTIVNTASVSGTGITTVSDTNTISLADGLALTITKALSPTTVTENGQVTYTFTIENAGNSASTSSDNIILSDTFDPPLSNLTVSYNGTAWTEGTQYTYTATSGVFSTAAGNIIIPAATYTQDSSGAWVTTPGVGTLTVTGTIS